MGRINGNKCKKSLIKALSVILAVLNLTQFSAMAAESKSRTSYPQQEDQKYEYDEEEEQKESFSKRHPILTVAGVAGIASIPLWIYVANEGNQRNTKIRELQQKVYKLENNYSSLSGRISTINAQLRSWDGRDLRELGNRLDALSDIINGSYASPGIRDRLNQLERSREDMLEDVLQQVARLSEAVNVADGVVQSPELRDRLAEISSNLSVINRQLNIQRERRYIEARNLRTVPDLQLAAENGRVYVPNMVERTEADIEETDVLKRKLHDLCDQFEVTQGTSCGDDNEAGWEESPCDYFFDDYTGRFELMGNSNKMRLAKIITLTYSHKDDERWRPAIVRVLQNLALHAGHCFMRANSITDAAYFGLITRIHQDRLNNLENNADVPVMNIIFSDIKEKILEKVKNLYVEQGRSGNPREPLIGFESVSEKAEEMLGMRNGRVYGGRATAEELINQVLTKRELMNLATSTLLSRYSDDFGFMDDNLFTDVNQAQLTVSEYCNIVGKSRGDIEAMVTAINECEDDELKAWANGERGLTFDQIRFKMGQEIEDLDESGCREIGSWQGVKFLMKCYREHYLENREDRN